MAYFDRFDICEAAYVFASDWHCGQWSTEHRIFARLRAIHFKPGAHVHNGVEGLSENGKELYGRFVRRYVTQSAWGWMRRAREEHGL